MEAHVKTTDVTGGVEWRPGEWKITSAATFAQERLRSTTDNIVDPTALNAALADPDPATAFNPFGDGSYTNPSTLDAIRTRETFSTRSSLRSVNLIAVRAGAVAVGRTDATLTLGGDYRDQSFSSWNRATLRSTPLSSDLQRSVSAAFAELRSPLPKRIEVSSRLAGSTTATSGMQARPGMACPGKRWTA